MLFGVSVSLIFLARFFIEFIKEKQVPFENQMKLDMGQLLSIPFILLGLGFIVYGYIKMKSTDNPREAGSRNSKINKK
jgi:prolipoprotein diacylglyceryltransferase